MTADEISDDSPEMPLPVGSTARMLENLNLFHGVTSSPLTNLGAIDRGATLSVLSKLDAFKGIGDATSLLGRLDGFEGFAGSAAVLSNLDAFKGIGGATSVLARLDAFSDVGRIDLGIATGVASASALFARMDSAKLFGTLDTSSLFAGLDTAHLFRGLDKSLQEEALDAATRLSTAGQEPLIEALAAVEPDMSESGPIDFVTLDLNDPKVRQILGVVSAFWVGLLALNWQLTHPQLVALMEQIERSLAISIAIYAFVLGRPEK